MLALNSPQKCRAKISEILEFLLNYSGSVIRNIQYLQYYKTLLSHEGEICM